MISWKMLALRKSFTLFENAGLTRLVTSRVPQYETLTAIFVNSFRFYSDNDTVVFRLYDRLLTMPMSKFCEVLGLPGLVEKKKRKNIPTIEISTLLDSFCNTEVRKSNCQKISNIMFPHQVLRLLHCEGSAGSRQHEQHFHARYCYHGECSHR